MSEMTMWMRERLIFLGNGMYGSNKKAFLKKWHFTIPFKVCKFIKIKKRLKQFIIYILVLIIGVAGSDELIAQEKAITLTGSVKGKESRIPIPDVEVFVPGGARTRTDTFGKFEIRLKIGDELVVRGAELTTVYYTVKSDEELEILVEGYDAGEELKKSKRTRTLTHHALLDSARYYKKRDIDKSLSFIEQSLTVLGNKGAHSERASSLEVLGDIYIFHRQYDLAVSNYKNALKETYSAEVKIKLARAYLLSKDFKEALKTYEQLKAERRLAPYQRIVIYEGLGDVYTKQGLYKKARNAYQTGLELARANKVTPKITDLNSKLGDAYAEEDLTEEAEANYGNALVLAKQENTKRAVREKEKVADFYNEKNEYDKEIELRKSTLREMQSLDEAVEEPASEYKENDSITTQKINYKIANAYIAKNNLEEAIPYLEKSIEEADKKEDLIVQKDATRKLSEVYRSTGDFTRAFETYRQYVELVDTLYVKKEQELAQVARINRDIALKQSRISGLEQERALSESRYDLALTQQQLAEETNKRQKIIIYSLILGMFLLAVTAGLFYRNNKQQKLANNLLALKSLRTQMNPHFIFNALNSVNNFIAKNDERSANRYLSEFSTLMRSVLENSEEDFIPLEKEIELLKLYTKLEHSRFSEKFDYDIEVDQHIDVNAFMIPPMLLQPYVENAIWHGLRYKETRGFLKIAFTEQDKDTLQITIQDNGIGRKQSQALKTTHQRKQKSKGMGNIKKRIAILNAMYKDKVDVSVADNIQDASGTVVLLTLKKD